MDHRPHRRAHPARRSRGPRPDHDRTILIAKGPESTIGFLRDACTTIGRAAACGDLVEWHTVELTIDYLEILAVGQANGDKQHRDEIETRLPAESRSTIDRFAELQDAAIDRARALLASRGSEASTWRAREGPEPPGKHCAAANRTAMEPLRGNVGGHVW